MPRSPATTGGWAPSWTPFRPPTKAAGPQGPVSGAAAGDREGGAPSLTAPSVGYSVPYKFRVEDNCINEEKRAQR